MDNAAASKEQATKNVGKHKNDYEQPVGQVMLNSFFVSLFDYVRHAY